MMIWMKTSSKGLNNPNFCVDSPLKTIPIVSLMRKKEIPIFSFILCILKFFSVPLPNNIANFCQPDGCTVICSNASDELEEERESSTFVFTLTDKDSNVTRYAVCHNFYRDFGRVEAASTPDPHQLYSRMSDETCLTPEAAEDEEDAEDEPWNFSHQPRRQISLVSICIVSHFEFFSNFKECVLGLRRLISTCNKPRLVGPEIPLDHHRGHRRRRRQHRQVHHDPWHLLVNSSNTRDLLRSSRELRSLLKKINDIEVWIDRLLEAPYPKETEARVELELFPQSNFVLTFALPDKHRLSLCDFPLHLPLELLGVTRCLQVRTYVTIFHTLHKYFFCLNR